MDAYRADENEFLTLVSLIALTICFAIASSVSREIRKDNHLSRYGFFRQIEIKNAAFNNPTSENVPVS